MKNKITLSEDQILICQPADSFPEGVLAAHQKLHAKLSSAAERDYYGVSWPDSTGKICYKAAVTEAYPEEAKELGLDVYLLKKDVYLCRDIKDYMSKLEQIGTVFQEMIAEPNIDPMGACVEAYTSQKDMRCMVRLAD